MTDKLCANCGQLNPAESNFCSNCGAREFRQMSRGLLSAANTGAIMKRAKTATGRLVQGVGVILWLAAGLATLLWTLYVLFASFGPLALLVALIAAPVTYVFAVLVVWFSTGTFPVLMLIPYLASWVGAILMGIGGSLAEDQG